MKVKETLIIMLTALLWSLVTIYPRTLITFQDNILVMSDFAYYITHIRAFWFEGKTNIYAISNHIAVNSSLAGTAVEGATPLGITPISTFIFFPFALIAKYSTTAAQILWMTVSLGLFLSSTYEFIRERINKLSILQNLPVITLTIIAISSSAMTSSILLGQTSVLATALLFQLFKRTEQNGTSYIISLIFVALCIKPTYGIFAACILVANRRYRDLSLAIIACLLLCLIFTFWCGDSWVLHYVESISALSSDASLSGYKKAFEPGTANIIRNVLIDYLPGAMALSISTYLFLFGTISLALWFIKSICNTKSSGIRPTKTIAAMLISVYLLFAPYVGSYEDLLILSLFGIVPEKLKNKDLSFYSIIIFILITLSGFMVFNFVLLQGQSPTILWFNKFIILISIVVILLKQQIRQSLLNERSEARI